MNGCFRIAFVLVAWFSSLPALGQRIEDPDEFPLHVRIDRAIAASHLGNCAELATDHEFARRVYLDLIGRSPTVEECQHFLADATHDKRARLIDQLLGSEEFNDFFARVIDVMLMERRAGNRIPQAEWIDFLRTSLSEHQSLDQIVRQVLTADGNVAPRGAAKFLLEREVEPNALTRDISRIFLGRDLQCAQCHDHPNIDDYLQSEYYGIYAFVSRSYLFADAADSTQALVGEKAEGGAEFKSVFSPDEDASQAVPNLLGGFSLDAEPRLDHELAYVTQPSKTTAGIPKFSRRGQLAWLMTHPANSQFARNAVNRLWAHMFGQGIVDPVDFDHSDNPPSQPALLQLLTEEFVRLDFDIRGLLRQLALSDAYQRSIEFPVNDDLSLAEVEHQSQVLESELELVQQQLQAVDAERSQQEQRLKAARLRVQHVDEKITSLAGQLAELDKELAALDKGKQDQQTSLSEQQQQLDTMQAAVAAAKQVADALPKDSELAKIHEDYRSRVDKLSQSIEGLKKSLAENEEQRVAANDKRSALLRRLARGKSDRMVLADMLAEARGAWRVFDVRYQHLENQRTQCRQRLAGLQPERKYIETAAALQATLGRLARVESNAPGLTQADLGAAKAKLASLDAAIQQDQQLLSSLTEQMTANAQWLAKSEAPLLALSRAIEDAQKAADALADEGLDSAVSHLEQRLNDHSQQLTAARTQALELEQRTASTQEHLRQLSQQQELAHEESRAVQTQLAAHEQDIEMARAEQQSALLALDLAAAERRKMWERKFVVRQLKPLTPEQLAGSTIAALGLAARFNREAEAEWSKSHQDQTLNMEDQQQRNEVEVLVEKRISQVLSTYVSLFAAPAGAPQDVFSSTADQALFLSNDGRLLNWLSPAEGTLLARVQKLDDLAAAVDELHLAILSRPATDQERAEVSALLESRASDRNQALRDIAWGLLSSLEFRFNH